MSKPYTKVLLLSIPRSGTNLLRSLMNSHPAICMHGEIFNWNLPARRTIWRDRPNYYLSDHEDTAVYLNRHVYPRDPGKKSVVGCKLFLHQLRMMPQFAPAYDHLDTMHDLRIIRLVRENVLDNAISLQIAHRDKQYAHQDEESEPPLKTIHIPYEEFVQTMHVIEREQAEALAAFPSHDRYTLTFNELTNNTDAAMDSLLRWLGLTPQPLSRTFKIQRQRTRPKSDVLENFHELRTQVAQDHPRWLRYFDEDPSELPTVYSALQTACAS